MTERPTRFTDEMVQAILAGNKTQTRRIMKTQLAYGGRSMPFPSWYLPTGKSSGILWPNGKSQILAMCPYGQPSDRLVVDGADASILLEIVSVRIERVQDITLGDICKEIGAASIYEFRPATYGFDVFAELWDEIYGEGSWNANPWVWVVEFKRVSEAA